MGTITGTELSETTLVGSSGDDTITGLGGDDLITTGIGSDTVNASAGKDTMVVDYSASTTKVTMTAPVDTGVTLAGTGFPAPGGADYTGVYNNDHTAFVATYSTSILVKPPKSGLRQAMRTRRSPTSATMVRRQQLTHRTPLISPALTTQ